MLWRRLLLLPLTLGQLAVGLGLGLVLAEIGFAIRDHGAFPHLNVYVPDEELGVRLAPSTSTRVRVADNAATSVRINARGFRGGEWPEPEPGEILVVGDSQVFGLGVEEDETTPAALERARGVTVLNAGVPTYGPLEYAATVEELVAERHPGVVVYVFNLANDLFELQRPNRERHSVWDGWAVRGTSAAPGLWFPGRTWLMQRSHLVFAVRELFAPTGPAEALPSEGTWQDVAAAAEGVQAPTPPEAVDRDLFTRRAELATSLEVTAWDLEQAFVSAVGSNDAFAAGAAELGATQGDVRDIVRSSGGEEARPINLTAYHLLIAAVEMDGNEARLKKLARETDVAGIVRALARRKELRAELAALRPPDAPEETPIDSLLEQVQAVTASAGARLVVVALPLDVMVSGAEWAKYDGVDAIDLSPASVLVDDLVNRARIHGITAVDPTAALRAKEPGAFLDGDLHLTPVGHEALAGAISDAIDEEPPRSALILPQGRSFLPTEDEFRRAPVLAVGDAAEVGCQIRRIREWMRVECLSRGDGESYVPSPQVRVKAGGHGDAALLRVDDGVALVVPVLPGDELHAWFQWYGADTARELIASIPGKGAPELTFRTRIPDPRPTPWMDMSYDVLRPTTCTGSRFGALMRCGTRCDLADPTACAIGHCEPWLGDAFCASP